MKQERPDFRNNNTNFVEDGSKEGEVEKPDLELGTAILPEDEKRETTKRAGHPGSSFIETKVDEDKEKVKP